MIRAQLHVRTYFPNAKNNELLPAVAVDCSRPNIYVACAHTAGPCGGTDVERRAENKTLRYRNEFARHSAARPFTHLSRGTTTCEYRVISGQRSFSERISYQRFFSVRQRRPSFVDTF